MTSPLNYLRKIAASAHVVTLQKQITNVATINDTLSDLLDIAPADFGTAELERSKRYLRRAAEAVAVMQDTIDENETHTPAMEEWHKELLTKAMETAGEEKEEARKLVEKLKEVIARY